MLSCLIKPLNFAEIQMVVCGSNAIHGILLDWPHPGDGLELSSKNLNLDWFLLTFTFY